MVSLKSYFARSIILTLVIALVGCGKKMRSQIQSPSDNFVKPKMSSVLKEIGINNDATNIDSGISVVFFSSFTCGTCKQEQKHVQDYIKGGALQVDLYTVLISVEEQQKTSMTNHFKTTIGFEWPIHTDPTLKAFKELCRADQTPCIVAVNKDNEVLLSHTGALPIADIEKKISTKLVTFEQPPTNSAPPIPPGIGLPPLPPPGGIASPGPSNGGRLDFIESLEVSVLLPQVEVKQIDYDTTAITRPLIVLFSSMGCSICIKENKELAALVKAADPRFKDVDILTAYLFPMSNDPNSDEAKQGIQEFRNLTKVEWPIYLDRMKGLGIELFSKYVQDPVGWGTTPGTAVFLPGKGRVFHKEAAHISEIEKALKQQ